VPGEQRAFKRSRIGHEVSPHPVPYILFNIVASQEHNGVGYRRELVIGKQGGKLGDECIPNIPAEVLRK
jgi:hypothetical protein